MEIEYEIEYTPKSLEDVAFWKKSGQKVVQDRITKLLNSISQTPTEGIGKPEPLKHKLSGCYSRNIDSKNRVIYTFNEDTYKVVIHSLRGHYYDK